jgi:hypothetical protein
VADKEEKKVLALSESTMMRIHCSSCGHINESKLPIIRSKKRQEMICRCNYVLCEFYYGEFIE